MKSLRRFVLSGVTLVLMLGLCTGGSVLAQKKGKDKEKAPEAPAQAAAPAPESAPAAATPSSAPYKIGVLDLREVVRQYNKRKEKYDRLQADVDRLQTEIKAMGEKIEAAKKEYEDSKGTLNDEQRLELKNKIEADVANYRSEFDKRQRQIDAQEEKVLAEVFKDIEAVLNQLAETEHYHLVLNAKGGPEGAILYHSPTMDITPKVLEILNKQSN